VRTAPGAAAAPRRRTGADEGIATPEDVDAAVRFGFGFRYLAAGPVLQRDHAGLADLQRWQSLREPGAVPDPPGLLLFVLGRYTAGQTSSPRDLVPFMHAHTGPEPWAVCAFGATEHACVTAAAALGGHVRVGFENNLQLQRWPDRTRQRRTGQTGC